MSGRFSVEHGCNYFSFHGAASTESVYYAPWILQLHFYNGLIFTIRNALEGHDPAMRKLRTIEDQDERNILIRRQAAAVSGNVLQWLLMIAALICIGLGAPIWIGFLMIGLSLLKLGVEFCLSIYYGDKL